MVKSQCNVCGLWFEDRDLDEHLNQHLNESNEQTKTEEGLKCPTCDIQMEAYFGVPFRVGGTGPGMRLLIGAWAELGEEPIPIDLFVCAKCGQMRFFATQKTRDRLKRAAPHEP